MTACAAETHRSEEMLRSRRNTAAPVSANRRGTHWSHAVPGTPTDSGWAAFAGVMMFLVGSLDAIWGLAAIFNDDVVVVGGHGAIIGDISLWGWVHLIVGSIVAITGVGLLRGQTFSRWLAVFLIAISAILQVVWFSAAPLWSFLLILLYVMIIYQLTARWDMQGRWD